MRLFMLAIFAMASISLSADAQLLKKNRPAKAPATAAVPQPMPAKAEPAAGVMTEGQRTLYDTARARAVGQLARKKNISRAEAKEMIDDVADNATLHMLATKAGVKVAEMPKGIGGFIQWLIDHQAQILALVKIILALFGVDAETATEIAIAIAWQSYCS